VTMLLYRDLRLGTLSTLRCFNVCFAHAYSLHLRSAVPSALVETPQVRGDVTQPCRHSQAACCARLLDGIVE
jgi:hypothetical protein